MEPQNEEETKSLAIEILRSEWDSLKKSGLLCKIGCNAGPQILKRENKKPIYNMLRWNATIKGPKKSPYEGYMFKFEIIYKPTYPKEAPTVTCKSNIYHMNISTDGDVCVTSIKEKDGWAKAGDISTVLTSIFVILSKPNIESPYRSKLRDLYVENKELYNKNAREQCEKYAIKFVE
jgi:ubiquitin-protein ligase